MGISEWLSNTFYNDISLIPVYLMVFMVALIILGAAIFFHEFGHWLWFRLQKRKNIKINFFRTGALSFHWEAGTEEDYNGLTKQEYNNMMATGVILGLLPIVIAGWVWLGFFLMIIPYGVGVLSDLKEMSDK